jgi:glycosyltransferase involved in cell wall biosynthesis
VNIAGIFLNKEIRTGGHVRYLELMEELASRGNKTVVLLNTLLRYDSKAITILSQRVNYRRRGLPPASWVFRSVARRKAGEIGRVLGRTDAVIVHGETHLAAGARLARLLNASLVYGHRSNSVREVLTYLSEKGHSPLQRLRFRLDLLKCYRDERRIGRLADLIVFQSPFDRDEFVARISRASGKVAVIRGNILGPRFLPEYALTNRSTAIQKIVFMGTLGPRKGVDYLVEAIIILASRGLGELAFEICGPGERRQELEGKLDRAGVKNAVTFHGRVPNPFLILAAGDLIVVPSLFDSYPDTVLEALHVGTPVIGSRVGGIPDQLVNDELLFPPMDAEAIAARIERCVREPEFYQRLRQLCAERRAAFEFGWAEAWESAITLHLRTTGHRSRN